MDPQGAVKRHTYHLRVDLAEKLRGYAYWNRLGISELMNQILEEFFEGKEGPAHAASGAVAVSVEVGTFNNISYWVLLTFDVLDES